MLSLFKELSAYFFTKGAVSRIFLQPKFKLSSLTLMPYIKKGISVSLNVKKRLIIIR